MEADSSAPGPGEGIGAAGDEFQTPMRSRALLFAIVAAVTAVSFAAAPATIDPCQATRAHRTAPATGVPRSDVEERGGLRVFAMQYKQEIKNVTSYESFAFKIDCMMKDYVQDELATQVPNLVVFNEDIGLATLAIGSRGAAARAFASSPLGGGAGDESGAPVAAAEALGLVNAGYARQIAYYQARFPGVDPRKQVFLAATDTFVRAFNRTFSDLAKRYGVYVVAANNEADYEESTDPADVAALADPDLADQYADGTLKSVYVATGPDVWNQVFLWGPDGTQLFRNKKVPLTPIEKDFIALDEGPATGPEAGPNIGPYAIPGTGAKLGFATSLPAFVYGYPFDGTPPADPCANTALHYMPCMDSLGVNVVIQDEANPSRWASSESAPYWQPLDWMGSTYRNVADTRVSFAYNVCPHMVGNLLDIAFDGQSAITSRAGGNPPRHYVGNDVGSAAYPSAYAGDDDKFVVLAPWLVGTDDKNVLRTIGARLAPGSGDVMENDYLETAVWADLVF